MSFSYGYQFGYRYGVTDNIELRDMASYISSIDSLVFFVNNVVLEGIETYSLLRQDTSAAKCVVRAFETLKFAVIKPIRTLCLRFMEQKKQINALHQQFVRLVYEQAHYKQALPLIDKRVIADPQAHIEYFYYAMAINLKLHRYAKAESHLNLILAVSKIEISDYVDKSPWFSRLTIIVLFIKLLDQPNLIKSFNQMMEAAKSSVFPFTSSIQAFFQVLGRYANQSSQLLTPEWESTLLKEDLARELYHEIKQSEPSLRTFASEQISLKYERIRLTDIKGVKVDEIEHMKQVNKLGNLAKYDCKGKILYLNHQKHCQHELNELVSRCYEMHQAQIHELETRENKKTRWDSLFPRSPHHYDY